MVPVEGCQETVEAIDEGPEAVQFEESEVDPAAAVAEAVGIDETEVGPDAAATSSVSSGGDKDGDDDMVSDGRGATDVENGGRRVAYRGQEWESDGRRWKSRPRQALPSTRYVCVRTLFFPRHYRITRQS